MSVNRTALLLVGLFLALSVSACDTKQDVPFDVPFQALVANPGRYDGRQVCTEGIYATGFETNALGASFRREGEAIYLTEPAIWLERAKISSSTDYVESGAFPTARFCRVTVCGLFEAGGSYGHLGGYAYQLRG